ncbi:MAG: SDR family oxidoreductase [Alphaproteobacteria bacterium]|jgi:NAD(P)-dependent dehydrogenase (short-subunit alcohol dehydrogenase family)|nr:SDR family oxidoreductase [Alphaproteobacteria bacterium]|tara:strand:+ start:1195 stop:1959 length:765 start_codon:yes stop_codon:yes gene_type:complete
MSNDVLRGKVALVTGAAQGIGLASAQAFASEGAAVGLLDINLEAVEGKAAAIQATGGRAMARHCDVRDEASVQDAVAAVGSALGAVNIGMCNAATLTQTASIAEMPLEDWNQALAVNLTGVFLTAKYLIPQMLSAGGGSIIITASQMARVATPQRGPYCATKGALLQLAKVIALEHAGQNIRANTLSPGGIATDRLARQYGDLEKAERDWGPAHPIGRLGQPDEIARAAVYLASDDSRFMTGSDLLIDGGYAAR